jgi:hypothetical protein
MYVLIGPVVKGLPLARLDFRTGCVSQVAPEIATIETNGRQVVADDVSEFGVPRIGEIVDSELQPVHPVLRGTMPAISADGRIATIRSAYPGYALHVWSPASGKDTKLYESRAPLIRPQWTSDGSILLLEGRGKSTQLVSIDRAGTRHVLTATPGARWMDLSSQGVVDVTDYASKTFIIDVRTGARDVLNGWYGMGWDPSGTTLVVARKTGAVGFSASPAFAAVSDVLQLPGGFLAGTAWVSHLPAPRA